MPNLSLFVKVPSKTYNAIGTNRANLVHAGDLNNCFSGAVIQNLGYFGLYIFHDGGSYHTRTSPLIYKANQWTGFYVIGTSAMTELKKLSDNAL